MSFRPMGGLRESGEFAQPAYRLHLGVHKTATTYIQTRLSLSETALIGAGIRTVLPEEFRGFYGLTHARNRQSRLQRWFRARKGQSVLSRELELIERSNPSSILISEENIIGNSRQILRTGKVYHQAAERLRSLPSWLNDPRTEVFLAIRNYADFFASCHAQLVRGGDLRLWSDYPTERLMDLALRWQDLVDAIRYALPKAHITLWRYEDFVTLEADVLRRMTGRPASCLAALQDRPMKSLTAEGIHRLVAMARARDVRPADIAHIVDQTGTAKGFARYDPWSPTDRARLDDAYEADWRSLRVQSDLTILRP
ncbi:MAG: hypothetical protein AAF367_17960 [Pseudomonadota bacterium]